MSKKMCFAAAILCAAMLILICQPIVLAEAGIEDGLYTVNVISSSEMFKVAKCELLVENGAIMGTLTLGGTGYGYLYAGTSEEASAAPETEWIPYMENPEGEYTYAMPITSLDTEIPVAAYSNKKETWYDRTLTFVSSTLAPSTPVTEETISVIAVEDGVYSIDVESDSGLLRVSACELTVADGVIRAELTAKSNRYDMLFVGSATEALTNEAAWIAGVQDTHGMISYAMEVSALDVPIAVATHAASGNMWYNRTLTFRSDTMAVIEPEAESAQALQDGTYVPDGFAFEGGTGRVTISCEKVVLEDGKATATIVFSSPRYTQVAIGEDVFMATSGEATSAFEIPVTLNADMEIVATTTAMSKAQEIAYTIHIVLHVARANAVNEGVPEIAGLTYESSTEIRYATCFKIHRYAGGYSLIDILDGARYLVVPEHGEVPDSLDKDIVVLKKPIEHIYLAATSAMALFDAMDALDSIRLTGTNASGWYIDNAVSAMEAGELLFAGKYSEPDFELLLREDCDLAVESTMILHNPEVQEMIELLGIPVLIDRSSYETHPLGRTEWVKLYAAIIGKEAEAAAFFDGQTAILGEADAFEPTGKTVAFFYISSDGSVVVHNPLDYVTKMIELAGGEYVFADVIGAEETRSSISISMEDFFAAAANADYLVYNATIDEPISKLDDLLAKDSVLADCKAVREGNVWCTGKYLYQATDIVGSLIGDFHNMLIGREADMTFLYKVD